MNTFRSGWYKKLSQTLLETDYRFRLSLINEMSLIYWDEKLFTQYTLNPDSYVINRVLKRKYNIYD